MYFKTSSDLHCQHTCTIKNVKGTSSDRKNIYMIQMEILSIQRDEDTWKWIKHYQE